MSGGGWLEALHANGLGWDAAEQITQALRERELHLERATHSSALPQPFQDEVARYVGKAASSSSVEDLRRGIRAARDSSTAFWESNAAHERRTELALKELRQIDHRLAASRGRASEAGAAIELVENEIKLVLRKKEAGHIAKAEQLKAELESIESKLVQACQERSALKLAKGQVVAHLLGTLEDMKQARERRLAELDQAQDSPDKSASLSLLTDMREILVRRREAPLQKEADKALEEVSKCSQAVAALGRDLHRACAAQQEALARFRACHEKSLKSAFFEQEFLKAFRLSLAEVAELVASGQALDQAQDRSELKGSLRTTSEAKSIFSEMLSAAEGESRKQASLIAGLRLVQERSKQLAAHGEAMGELEAQLEVLASKKAKAEAKIQAKIARADILAYKALHGQVEALEGRLREGQAKLKAMRAQAKALEEELSESSAQLAAGHRELLLETLPQSLADQGRDLACFVDRLLLRLSSAAL